MPQSVKDSLAGLVEKTSDQIEAEEKRKEEARKSLTTTIAPVGADGNPLEEEIEPKTNQDWSEEGAPDKSWWVWVKWTASLFFGNPQLPNSNVFQRGNPGGVQTGSRYLLSGYGWGGYRASLISQYIVHLSVKQAFDPLVYPETFTFNSPGTVCKRAEEYRLTADLGESGDMDKLETHSNFDNIHNYRFAIDPVALLDLPMGRVCDIFGDVAKTSTQAHEFCRESMKFKIADLLIDVPKTEYEKNNPEAEGARANWVKCSYYVHNLMTFLNSIQFPYIVNPDGSCDGTPSNKFTAENYLAEFKRIRGFDLVEECEEISGKNEDTYNDKCVPKEVFDTSITPEQMAIIIGSAIGVIGMVSALVYYCDKKHNTDEWSYGR